MRGHGRGPAREERREAFVDAAVALIRRDGPFVTMEQIAAECGITKPVIYRHFGDRDGLVMNIAGRFVDQLVADLAPLMVSDAPAHALLLATIDTYLQLVERDTHLYRFLTNQAGADRRDLVARLVAEEVSIVLEHRMAAAGLDPAPARPWAYALVGMVHFAGDWWIDDRSVDRDELGELLATLVWDGLAQLDLDGRTRARNAPFTPSTAPTRTEP